MNDKKTILLADDEMHITHLLTLNLEQAGFAVLTADDGEQAYQLACQHLPDLIITDYQMSILTGYQLSRKLFCHKQAARVPLIMLTARGHELTDRKLAQTNIQVVIDKPFAARELIAKAVQMLLDTDRSGTSDKQEGKAA